MTGLPSKTLARRAWQRKSALFRRCRTFTAAGVLLLLLSGSWTPACAEALALPAPAARVAAIGIASDLDPLNQRLIDAVARSAGESRAYDQKFRRQGSAIPDLAVPMSEYAVTVHRGGPALAAPTETSAVPVSDHHGVTVHRGGPTWAAPTETIAALVDTNSPGDLDNEATCLATAVYFESKGEPLDGQLAVAQVILNRAASGLYPTSLCGVVKQHAQFSFVRNGEFPAIDTSCSAWRKAKAIARIAGRGLIDRLPSDVLWYHADYVSPRWRQGLVRVEKIGAHIFYRA